MEGGPEAVGLQDYNSMLGVLQTTNMYYQDESHNNLYTSSVKLDPNLDLVRLSQPLVEYRLNLFTPCIDMSGRSE